MSINPAVNGKQAIQALRAFGFEVIRISGSLHVLRKPGHNCVPVPVHGNKEIPPGTPRSIIRLARLTPREFYGAM